MKFGDIEYVKSMTSRYNLLTYSLFVVKSVSTATVVMFLCMAMGELFFDKNLFSGFLQKPSLWALIFIETCVAAVPMTVLGALFLYRFRLAIKKKFVLASVTTWLSLSALLVGLYAHFYWTREWYLTSMAPGLIFGWILPGTLTLICFVRFSLKLRQEPSDT